MVVVSFSLSQEAVGKIYDSLVCLGKFSESVSIEATTNQFVLTALNPTKSAYASFAFESVRFFTRYTYNPPRKHGQLKEKFSCRIYNKVIPTSIGTSKLTYKALLAVFRGRAVDSSRENDTDVERCDVDVEDGEDKVQSRLVIKFICKNGMLKSYRLTFESVPSMHVRFNTELVKSRWSISARVLREFVDHFGPKTELLDIYSEGVRASFTSYTEKVVSGTEILKQPLHTSIAIDTHEFSEFGAEEKLHIVISVKDFKAIITHAGISNPVYAAYSHPSEPFQLKYEDDGMACEFILMTVGDFRERSKTTLTAAASGSRTVSRQALEATASRVGITSSSTILPTARRAPSAIARDDTRIRVSRPSPPPPEPSVGSNSLFLPEFENDRNWDPIGENNEDEEMLGWDASYSNDENLVTLSRALPNQNQERSMDGRSLDRHIKDTEQLPPTQRVSQIRGIFDD